MANKEKGLSLEQDLFCRLYSQNRELFGNATLAYAQAYNYKLEELSDEKPIIDKVTKKLGKSEKELAYNVCSVQGSLLLRNPRIQDKVTLYLNELLKDDEVDSELSRLIKQDKEPATKIAAIREYNKLRGRIIEKADFTSKGEQITATPELVAMSREYEEKLKQQI